MLDIKEFEIEIFEDVLKRYETQYSELLQLWNDYERKAQYILTISGVLISVSSLLVKQFGTIIPTSMKLLFCIAIITLVFSVAFSIQVIQLRNTVMSPSGNAYNEMSLELIQAINSENDYELQEYKISFLKDKITFWNMVTEKRRRDCINKTYYLTFANYSLLISLLLIASMIIISVQQKI